MLFTNDQLIIPTAKRYAYNLNLAVQGVTFKTIETQLNNTFKFSFNITNLTTLDLTPQQQKCANSELNMSWCGTKSNCNENPR